MVFGLFENNGTLELRVNGASFSPGQKITGTVVLNLTKPTKARELRVSFYGTVHGRKRSIRHIFEVRQILSGEKIYSPGESYAFELLIPMPVVFHQPDNIVGELGANRLEVHPLGWYVLATLDIALFSSLKKSVQITLVGDMVTKVKAPAATQEQQMAIVYHNQEAWRLLAGGAPEPAPGQAASPPQTPPVSPV